MKTVLTIAGSDSSGGAGIQADLKTMIMNGVFGMSAVTALTAQNTIGVSGIMAVDGEFLRQQIDAVFEDIRPDAVKIGMAVSKELIQVMGERLRFYRAEHIVVDPVMVSTSGSRLIQPDAVEALTRELFPLAQLVTPNIPEAELLSGRTIADRNDMELAVKGRTQRPGCRRSSVCRRKDRVVCWKADRHIQYPRNGLHPVKRHRFQPGQGLFPQGIGEKIQGISVRRPFCPDESGSGKRPCRSQLLPERIFFGKRSSSRVRRTAPCFLSAS